LDENNTTKINNTVTVVSVSPKGVLPEKCNSLDLGFDTENIIDAELVGNPKKKAKVQVK